jgi:hypothetical protein
MSGRTQQCWSFRLNPNRGIPLLATRFTTQVSSSNGYGDVENPRLAPLFQRPYRDGVASGMPRRKSRRKPKGSHDQCRFGDWNGQRRTAEGPHPVCEESQNLRWSYGNIRRTELRRIAPDIIVSPGLQFRPHRGFAGMVGAVLHVSGNGTGRFMENVGRFSVV